MSIQNKPPLPTLFGPAINQLANANANANANDTNTKAAAQGAQYPGSSDDGAASAAQGAQAGVIFGDAFVGAEATPNRFSMGELNKNLPSAGRGETLLPTATEPVTQFDNRDTMVHGLKGDWEKEITKEFGQEVANLFAQLTSHLGKPQADAGDDPSLSASDVAAGIRYAPIDNASLWGDGKVTAPDGTTQPSDAMSLIDQGNLGNCYFLASLANVAANDPDALKAMVRPKADGNGHEYQVRFYTKDPETGAYSEEWIDVDDDLPVNPDGTTAYAQLPVDSAGRPVIGVALIEKAYAKFNDKHKLNGTGNDSGYEAIGNGGTGVEALQAITGKDAQQICTSGESFADSGMTEAQMEVYLNQANAPAHLPVQVLTTGTDNTLSGGTEKLAGDLVPGHDYTVLGTFKDPTTGQTMVSLRNPWGMTMPDGYAGAGNNGVFSIPLSTLMQGTCGINMQVTPANDLPDQYNRVSQSAASSTPTTFRAGSLSGNLRA